MKVQRGWLAPDAKKPAFVDGESRNDNHRVKRYVAKYTINPAISTASSHEGGLAGRGQGADIVIWRPAFFGVKTVDDPEGRPDCLGADGRCQRLDPDAAASAWAPDVWRLRQGVAVVVADLLSQAAMKLGVAKKYGLQKNGRCREEHPQDRKSHMVLNAYQPHMEIDVETYEVRADGQLLTCEPAKVLPMAQRYFLFLER